jgi:hypothetical protein
MKTYTHPQLVMMIAVIFIPFFAQNIQTLFAGQLLAGIPWGRKSPVEIQVNC